MIYRVKANIRAEMTSNEKLRVKFNDIFKEKIDYYCDKGISFYKETEDGYEQKILEKMKKNIDI
jgi:hypothetical protein